MYRTTPYTDDEQRVCDFLQALAPDIGCGDDPIGFVMAQCYWWRLRSKRFELALRTIADSSDREASLPACDVLDECAKIARCVLSEDVFSEEKPHDRDVVT